MGMQAASLWIAGAGLALQAYGTYRAGKTQKKAATEAAKEEERAGAAAKEAAESAAELSDYNAGVAKLQAQDAIERGAEAESRFRSQIRMTIGQQRAGFAGGNIDVNYGSAVDVQADAAFLGEMDALQIRTNAARESWGYNVEAENYRLTGEIQRKEGVNAALAAQAIARGTRAQGNAAQSAANWQTAGTLLGGSASLLQMAYAFKK